MEVFDNDEVLTRVIEKKVDPKDIADPFARKLVGRYLDNRRNDVDKLAAALNRDDFALIEVTGHNLFGSGGAYGLGEISRIGAAMEEAAASSDRAKIAQLINELAEFIGQAEQD